MLRELVERCIAKEKSAWKEFIRNFEEIVQLSIKLKLAHLKATFCEEDIKDISQNVFTDIWQKDKLAKIREKNKIKSWISIVAQNAAVDYIRKNSFLKKRVNLINDLDRGELDILDIIPSRIPNPSKKQENIELQTIIDDFLKTLPDQNKLILNLNLFYEKAHIEIAKILNISVNTVSTIIRRSKKKLRQHLKDKGVTNY